MEKERGAIPGLMVAKTESQSGHLRGVGTLHLKVRSEAYWTSTLFS